jgi:hypothetical protein
MKKIIKTISLLAVSLVTLSIAQPNFVEIKLPDTLNGGKYNKETFTIGYYRLLNIDFEHIEINTYLRDKNYKYYLIKHETKADGIKENGVGTGKIAIENTMLLKYRRKDYIGNPDTVFKTAKEKLLFQIQMLDDGHFTDPNAGEYEINTEIIVRGIDKQKVIDTMFTKKIYVTYATKE